MSTSRYFSTATRMTRNGAKNLTSAQKLKGKLSIAADQPAVSQNDCVPCEGDNAEVAEHTEEKGNKKKAMKRSHVKVEYSESQEIKKTNIEETIKESAESINGGKTWMPANWKLQWDNIFEMRKARNAPVDSMGCDVISDRDATPEVEKNIIYLAFIYLCVNEFLIIYFLSFNIFPSIFTKFFISNYK